MGKTSTNKMSHVVSCRVNEREMDTLRRQALKSGISITTLLRQSLDLPYQASVQTDRT